MGEYKAKKKTILIWWLASRDKWLVEFRAHLGTKRHFPPLLLLASVCLQAKKTGTSPNMRVVAGSCSSSGSENNFQSFQLHAFQLTCRFCLFSRGALPCRASSEEGINYALPCRAGAYSVLPSLLLLICMHALLLFWNRWYILVVFKIDGDDADGFGHRNCYQLSSTIAKVLCIEIATTCPGRSTRTSRQLMHRQISPGDNFTLINLEVEAKNIRVAGCCSCSFYIHTPICCTCRIKLFCVLADRFRHYLSMMMMMMLLALEIDDNH